MFFKTQIVFTLLATLTVTVTASPLPSTQELDKRTWCPIRTEACILHCDYDKMCWCPASHTRTFCYLPEGCDVICNPTVDPEHFNPQWAIYPTTTIDLLTGHMLGPTAT